MKPIYKVTIDGFAVLRSIAGNWNDDDYRQLLDDLDYGDTSELKGSDLCDMCILSMQDLAPEKAAALLLKHKLQGKLTEGQIANVSVEMLDEKMWEEYSDMALHESMFAVGSLLYQAFPQSFPEPDAVAVNLTITGENSAAQEALSQVPHESFLVRLLSDGMDENSVLHRLFADQLKGQKFAEAELIVWIVEASVTSDAVLSAKLTSSGYWLDSLRQTKSFQSNAVEDER